VERAPKKVIIHRLELVRFSSPDVEISVDCGPGTYVRALAADLGAELGCGAYLESLRRTRSEPFTIDQALDPTRLDEEARAGTVESNLIPAAQAMGLPVVVLAKESTHRVLHGGDVSPGSGLRQAPGARLIALDEEDHPLALLELRADRRLWPLRVLRQP
jgi:tRNA pseudouridine55 synthase